MTKTNKKSGNPAKKAEALKQAENKGTLAIGWCDNGNTDGKFTEGLVYTIVGGDLPVHSALRVQGNQIGRQRQTLFDVWLDETDFDWLLWVDSDIQLTKEVLNKLWATADKDERPVVTGVYFISKENEQSTMMPMPAVFNFTDDEHKIQYLHPLPKSSIVKVDCAGFGLVLMHRSAGLKLRAHHAPRKTFFNETGVGEEFISEDIHFFRALKEADVPVHAHTGALVKHMKRFALDLNYYIMYWNYKTYEANQRSEA